MTFSRREFFTLLGSRVIPGGGFWQAKSFDAKAWRLEDLMENVHYGGPPKDGISPMIGLKNILK